ncbi:DNA polymerase beta superfamily protein [Paenibacillus wulumuqiensis]|uniref:DNA polymerase beta superfamily protein n=1 Tax=Paenibacillus wulumuqiensis TaxID=1567107 RepID=UPI000619EED8|nr:nucleotidyltransferase domain-containing protein [Paenibacillus wulumuqiensis]
MPPMEFQQLVAELLPDGQLREDILHLLERKMAGDELNLESPIPSIHHYLEHSIADLEAKASLHPASAQNLVETLDQLFRDTLRQVWS